MSKARKAGDAGAAQAACAADRRSPGYTWRALEQLRKYAAHSRGASFTIENARRKCEPVPEGADARCWGSITTQALKAGYIQKSYGLMLPAKSSHGSVKPCYQRGPSA